MPHKFLTCRDVVGSPSGGGHIPRKAPSRVMSIMSHVSNAMALEQQIQGNSGTLFGSAGSENIMKRASRYEPQDLEGVDFDRSSNASSRMSQQPHR